ncbi:PREDICTED: glycerate kinase-like, partial [Rhagoletis zephyria]|uniref:glycerate kinase-like n=1 Tax=Rhagoletis zephyria TaxID=28612 RepID=UPI00081133E3
MTSTTTSKSSATKLLLTDAYRTAIAAVQPSSLISTAVQLDPASGVLKVTDQLTKSSITTVELPGRNVFIIGAGKAVLGMATELLRKVEEFNSNNNNALQNQNQNQNQKKVIITISKGQLNIPHGSEVNDEDKNLLNRNSITLCKGAKNNLPDDDSVAATRSILELIKEAKKLPNNSSKTPPLILAFISGGGSALLSLPRPPATLYDKQKVISGLVRAGADIVALNSVRGRLSKVKHGQLAELIISDQGPKGQALELVTFIVSDIIGDPIDKIASGPTVVLEDSKNQDSISPLEVLQQFNVPVEDKIRQLLTVENTDLNKARKVLNQNLLQNVLIGNNAIAVAAAEKVIVQKSSSKKNFKVVVQGSAVCGEVKEVVAKFITDLEDQGKETQKEGLFAGVCLLAGGETTVDMKDAKEI